MLFLLPLFLQELLGLTALQSGLTTFPQAIGMILASQIVGRLYHSVGPRRLMFGGLFAMSVVTLPLVFVQLDTSLWVIRAIMFVRGICMAFSFVPVQAASYANIEPADTGRASAIYSTQRQVAASLGVAMLATCSSRRRTTTTTASRTPPRWPTAALDAFHLAFLAAADRRGGGCVLGPADPRPRRRVDHPPLPGRARGDHPFAGLAE